MTESEAGRMFNLTTAKQEEVIVSALAATGGSRSDLLFAAGSMVDGVANAGSDLDLYFIGSGAAAGSNTTTRKLEKNGTVGSLDGRELNLSILDPVGLAELSENFRRCLASLANGGGIAQLDSENDLKVLHRIRSGVPLLGADKLTSLRRDLETARLAEYLANLHAVTAMNRLVDVDGEIGANNLDSAAWMLREATIHIAYMVLALSGETNPSRKWLLRLLLRGQSLGPLAERALQQLRRPTTSVQGDATDLRLMLRQLISQQTIFSAYVGRLAHEKL